LDRSFAIPDKKFMEKKIEKKLKVKKFWESQAITLGESQLATAPDIYFRELEIKQYLCPMASRSPSKAEM